MNFHIKVIEATFEAPNSNVESVLSLYNLGPTRGILIRLLQNGHTMKLYVAKVPVADRRSQVAARDQQSLKSIILSVQKSSKKHLNGSLSDLRLRTNDWCKHILQLKDFAPSHMVQKLAVRHTAVQEIGLPIRLEMLWVAWWILVGIMFQTVRGKHRNGKVLQSHWPREGFLLTLVNILWPNGHARLKRPVWVVDQVVWDSTSIRYPRSPTNDHQRVWCLDGIQDTQRRRNSLSRPHEVNYIRYSHQVSCQHAPNPRDATCATGWQQQTGSSQWNHACCADSQFLHGCTSVDSYTHLATGAFPAAADVRMAGPHNPPVMSTSLWCDLFGGVHSTAPWQGSLNLSSTKAVE